MLELVLVRHGETEWNASEIYRGRADVALNENGIRQAELLGEYLSKEKIDFVYSSPLIRAVKTAEAIAIRQSLEVNTISNLVDIDFGEWQGMSLKEVKEKYPDLYRDWEETPEQVKIPGGESLEEVRRRTMPFVEDAVIRCGDGRIILVLHRVIGKVLFCALLGIELSYFRRVKIDTCGITRFSCGGGRQVLTVHNDTSFLESMQNRPLNDF